MILIKQSFVPVDKDNECQTLIHIFFSRVSKFARMLKYISQNILDCTAPPVSLWLNITKCNTLCP